MAQTRTQAGAAGNAARTQNFPLPLAYSQTCLRRSELLFTFLIAYNNFCDAGNVDEGLLVQTALSFADAKEFN